MESSAKSWCLPSLTITETLLYVSRRSAGVLVQFGDKALLFTSEVAYLSTDAALDLLFQ